MAEVLLFPQKKRIPTSFDERFGEIAKQYVETLQALVVLLDVNLDNTSEYEETLGLVQESFIRGIIKAAEEMEED